MSVVQEHQTITMVEGQSEAEWRMMYFARDMLMSKSHWLGSCAFRTKFVPYWLERQDRAAALLEQYSRPEDAARKWVAEQLK